MLTSSSFSARAPCARQPQLNNSRSRCAVGRGCQRPRSLKACCSAQNGNAMCVQEAWTLLKQLTKDDMRKNAAQYAATADARELLRQAVQTVASNPAPSKGWDPTLQPPEILLGVLSSDVRLAVRALRDWTNALHIPFVVPQPRAEGVAVVTSMKGSVYIKYNAASQQCYATQYDGRDRGVLVTFGGTLVGHLPLGLFDEGMQQPAPLA